MLQRRNVRLRSLDLVLHLSRNLLHILQSSLTDKYRHGVHALVSHAGRFFLTTTAGVFSFVATDLDTAVVVVRAVVRAAVRVVFAGGPPVACASGLRLMPVVRAAGLALSSAPRNGFGTCTV
jgi:hypothetical protein